MRLADTRPPFAGLTNLSWEALASLPTPCYLLDEGQLRRNGEILLGVQQRTGCKILLAQKAFSNFNVYPVLAPYLAGTEASGLYESRLGKEELPEKENHVFCAAYRADEFAELLQYAVDATDILPQEAAALLAGIVLDTKHFTQRTGGRTFEAAAFLRRSGADTAEVQRLFQGDLKDMVTKYDIIRRAEMYRSNIAVSVVEEPGVDRVAAAQAADDLLTLKGVQASFVIYAAEGAVLMSARSLGEINVQVILEALGGGGNSTTAGARIDDTDRRASVSS